MPHLDLMLFTTDPAQARSAARAGIDGLIVDWESRGKAERQHGQDMEVNADTAEDVARLTAAAACPITVRVNALGAQTAGEIALALSCGARGIMLPMARNADDVEAFLGIVDKRARTIIQIETQDLVADIDRLASLTWDAAYIGLHDLMLTRGARSMWEAILDGTVEHVMRTLSGRAVGFGGVTVIGGGHPIRFTLILQELARLGARLSFLRRTFRREILDRNLVSEIESIRSAWAAACIRGPIAIEQDRTTLFTELERLTAASTPCASS